MSADEQELVPIAFRGTREYRRKIKRAAIDREVNVQVFLEAAVESYLNTASTAKVVPMSGVPQSLQPVVDAFIRWWTRPKTSIEKPAQKFIADTIGVPLANGEKEHKTNGA